MNYGFLLIYGSFFLFSHLPILAYQLLSHGLISVWLFVILDIALAIIFLYLILVMIGEQRIRGMLRGLLVLIIPLAVSQLLGLVFLSFILEKLIFAAMVTIVVMFQSQLRRFLEQLGRGNISQLLQPPRRQILGSDTVIDEIVDAIKELSQNRTGALIVIEISGTMDERDFLNSGVLLNAEVSKELLQTIFQTSTLLHDGAVFIRSSQIVAAGVILPLSERTASRQLGTRHRAAMGITERVENCLCIVVSEETGSISLAEQGALNRPLTSSKLKELLEKRFFADADREAVPPGLGRLSRKISFEGFTLFKDFFSALSLTSKEKK